MSKYRTYGAQTPKCFHESNLIKYMNSMIKRFNVGPQTTFGSSIVTNIDFGYRFCQLLHRVLINIEKSLDLRTREMNLNPNLGSVFQGNQALLDESTSIQEQKPSESEEDLPSFKCPLCLVNLQQRKPMSTRCGHIFCRQCIQTALKFAQKCPVCKKRLLRKHIFRIYLY
ncbi:E3 ubiquitin-protein ligase complex slx8-rfp subunit slx8-like isoform X1 [Drosophila elegans]|uniref:E3 ubiquitin-protein ligase complex slx8-rfp subunit slx8-like isoform X1 n=1 Tax=Drosophila elegans TaxID=30023 RepID=UPI0007E67908|nr:E3 ubiquitin-protein ligase complex slx8-rfp subunit slx8-like isoform X1 [Drosophila elegans]